jgi:hypothetical protein
MCYTKGMDDKDLLIIQLTTENQQLRELVKQLKERIARTVGEEFQQFLQATFE